MGGNKNLKKYIHYTKWGRVLWKQMAKSSCMQVRISTRTNNYRNSINSGVLQIHNHSPMNFHLNFFNFSAASIHFFHCDLLCYLDCYYYDVRLMNYHHPQSLPQVQTKRYENQSGEKLNHKNIIKIILKSNVEVFPMISSSHYFDQRTKYKSTHAICMLHAYDYDTTMGCVWWG